jgi:putative two-component system response regulator
MDYLQSYPADLILLDLHMPEMNGFEFLSIIQNKGLDIPVILLTSDDAMESEIKAFENGVIDYIKKPIFKENLMMRIRNHIHNIENIQHLKKDLDWNLDKIKSLEEKIVMGVRIATDLRDIETGLHIKRIAIITSMLSTHLKTQGMFEIGEKFIVDIEKASTFHDIGKIGICDAILKKPGKLTDEEYEIMKSHTIIGRDAIRRLMVDDDESFLSMAEDIALYHHERWDGRGYPKGISNTAIPLSARIVAIADVYDALVSKRIYKPPMSHEEAIEILKQDSGKHFDPTIVSAFITISDDIHLIMQAWQDLS